jgi:hypothetical protein
MWGLVAANGCREATTKATSKQLQTTTATQDSKATNITNKTTATTKIQQGITPQTHYCKVSGFFR